MIKANIWAITVPVETVTGSDGSYDYVQTLNVAQTIANITKPTDTFNLDDPIVAYRKFDQACCDPSNYPKSRATANGIKWPYRTIMLMNVDGVILLKING